jgi:hypothetical protein
MPIDYRRDDRRRLITVTLTEPVSFDELLGQTDRQWTEDTWEYAVLYDTRASVHRFPPGELQQLLDRTQAVGGGRARGPVGVAIASRPEKYASGLELTTRAGPRRDIEILLNVGQIDAWLVRHAARRGRS